MSEECETAQSPAAKRARLDNHCNSHNDKDTLNQVRSLVLLVYTCVYHVVYVRHVGFGAKVKAAWCVSMHAPAMPVPGSTWFIGHGVVRCGAACAILHMTPAPWQLGPYTVPYTVPLGGEIPSIFDDISRSSHFVCVKLCLAAPTVFFK